MNLYKCSCGAYGIDDNTDEIKWACSLSSLNNITKLNLSESDFNNIEKSYICDYCINHYGLDICKCGSGEKVNECSCHCNLPSQTYKQYERRTLWAY